LFQWRALLLRDLDLIANQVSLECGKTPAEAKAGLLKGVEVLEFALSLQNADTGGKIEVSRGVFCEYRREALGVTVGVTPFNFPAMVPMWMIPISIALGNSFVWKPSDKTPLTSIWLAKLFSEAGLPPGVFSVLHGGQETVETLITHPLVQAVGFVGSSPVARKVFHKGSLSDKRVLALGGAKNHIILLPDADLEMSARGISESFTACAGQRCMASAVLVAVGNCDVLIEKILERVREIQCSENMGAIISPESVARIKSAIDKASQDGAKISIDGRNPKISSEKYKAGYWLNPTVLDHVTDKMEISCTEVFGPVLSIVRVKTLSEAIALESQCKFGNAASIFTSNGASALRLMTETQAGMVGVNVGVPVPREPFSFGGTKESKFGHGEITGMGAVDFWSNRKKITQRWFLGGDKNNEKNWMS
jgi:malonate-semialdehyde dehydrogenase (acetylating)/methylmalonate-semialdehyde dehydrogenase